MRKSEKKMLIVKLLNRPKGEVRKTCDALGVESESGEIGYPLGAQRFCRKV